MDKPIVYDKDVECIQLGRRVTKWLLTCMSMTSELETDQGILLKGEYIGKLYKKSKAGVREWIIKGVPDLHIDYTAPGIPAVTRGTKLVNRIPAGI